MRRFSLRTQLLGLGLAAAVVPLIALVAVVFSVEQDETFDASGQGTEVVSESGVSPWVPAAALVLAAGAIVVVRVWAQRAVDPIERMAEMTDAIQAGSLDQRLDLRDAPEEIRRLGESFDRMLERLEASTELERQRIEDASHELRTPLAALAARLDVAARRKDLGEIADDLVRCERDVERLQGTLDSLLASARDRHHQVAQIDTDLVAIIDRVVEHHRLVNPEVDVEVRAPTVVRLGIDGSSVERAVVNLVQNAARHGGGSAVSVEIVDTAEAVAVIVTDDGPGIEPDQLASLFDRYAGADHGVGLALVKQVADAYGDVTAESPVADGRGARFTLRLRR